MKYLTYEKGKKYTLKAMGKAPEQVHVFDEDSVLAINAAVAAGRPLLVRGEPGTGKTQLARAAAKALGWAFISETIDARSEATGLLYHMDAVTRLGEAQVLAALGTKKEQDVRKALAEERYVHPRALWWAFNWKSASEQAKRVKARIPAQPDAGKPEKGCVVLIDEIDKADADLPNGLLEAFGNGHFHPPALEESVHRGDHDLLIVITTNEEKALPDAFLRRCLVLQLRLPEGRELIDHFVAMGEAHFGDEVDSEILRQAAKMVEEERKEWQRRHLSAPGLAEFLDLIRAIVDLADSPDEQKDKLKQLKDFVLKKHPEGDF